MPRVKNGDTIVQKYNTTNKMHLHRRLTFEVHFKDCGLIKFAGLLQDKLCRTQIYKQALLGWREQRAYRMPLLRL